MKQKEFKARKYQRYSIKYMIDKPESGLFLDMGLGKSVITLTAIDELINRRFEINRVLVIAPKRVAQEVWPDELQKWKHLKFLSSTLIEGTEKQRRMKLAEKTDIHIIGVDMLVWLVAYLGDRRWPYDMVVIDELSKFKSWKTGRFAAMELVRPKVKRITGLTGTPAPNGFLDLWAPMKLLDQGERLGEFISDYKDRFFITNKYDYSTTLRPHETDPRGKKGQYYEKYIMDKLSDICISMKSEDYIDLPELIRNKIVIPLPEKIMKQYYDFQKELVLEIEDEDEITAANAVVLSNKLRQFANGAIYREDGSYLTIHEAKMDALEELIDAASGKPLLVAYSWRHDLDRILTKFKKLKPSRLRTTAEIADWNRGKIKLAVVHPKSAGHGLNLQFGGYLAAYYGLTWSEEENAQFVKRLHRPGQKYNCVINYLIAKMTIDERVLETLGNKASTQGRVMDAVKAIFKEVKNKR